MVRVCRGALLLVGLAAGLAGGCAHDIPGWKRVSSDHFHLFTDLGAHSYEPVLERLEDVHGGLASSFFRGTVTPPLEVFLFTEGEFRELAGPWGGLYIGQRGKGGALAIYDGWDPRFVDVVAAHELAHGFIAATFPSVPNWFNEGFASYLESIIVEQDKVWFGSIGTNAGLTAGSGKMVPIAALFAAPWRDFHGDWESSHYATAWAVVHYILHGEDRALRRRFDQFGVALARGGGGASARAWQEVFPEIPLAELVGRVRDHIGTAFARHVDSRMGFRFQRPAQGPLQVEAADPARVEAMRAALRRGRKPDRL
jgi:hypothetical protein